MNTEKLFTIYNTLAMIGCLPLLLAPRWRVTQLLIMSGWWSIFMAVSYLVFFIIALSGSSGLDMGSIAAIRESDSG